MQSVRQPRVLRMRSSFFALESIGESNGNRLIYPTTSAIVIRLVLSLRLFVILLLRERGLEIIVCRPVASSGRLHDPCRSEYAIEDNVAHSSKW